MSCFLRCNQKITRKQADLIDGSIGELSPFHDTFGYYAHGVGIETCTLPKDWEEKLIKLENANTNGIVGLCLEENDLAITKYVAGREKDLAFTKVLATEGITNQDILLERLNNIGISTEFVKVVKARILSDFKE